MGHLTYEEKFVVKPGPPYADNNDIVGDRFRTHRHPDFCQVCWSKMAGHTSLDTGTTLKTLLTDDDNDTIYAANGSGGCEPVWVRPHVVHGSACGFRKGPGASLWHATIWRSTNSICQLGMAAEGNEKAMREVIDMMGIKRTLGRQL
tara:strand:- start:93 stop:533 length:441 start_codon:yes stop_codon:yes gene_type:complete